VEVEGENGCPILRGHPRFVVSGDPAGKVRLHSPSNLRVEHVLDAHTGSLSDFDVHGNTVVTCGFSSRMGNLAVDHILMVYDLRMMRATTPVQVAMEPFLLRFIPSFSSRLAILSASGQLQLLETSNSDLCLCQVETPGAMFLTFDIAPTCQAMAFGDSAGYLHVYATNPEAMFNAHPRDTEFPDPIDPIPHIPLDDVLAPLASVPLPFCPAGQPYLSDWPAQFTKKVYW
ncbi:unnamed protein product, partial [Darwinula stevensoni]